MHLEDYFEDVVRTLEQGTGGQFPSHLEIEYRDEEWGAITDTLSLPNGWKLDVKLSVDMRLRGRLSVFPEWRSYSFQLRDATHRLVWRFDNWPHHLSIAGFPHHKHAGQEEQVQVGRISSLRELLRELEDSLPAVVAATRRPVAGKRAILTSIYIVR
ncbi:MAG: DUF6516 family protein [Dehalococcoidia bacterium]